MHLCTPDCGQHSTNDMVNMDIDLCDMIATFFQLRAYLSFIYNP